MSQTLNHLINLRGMRQQVDFAMGLHRSPRPGRRWSGMKGCYHRGCEIFTPLANNLKGANIADAITLDRFHQGEVRFVIEWAEILLKCGRPSAIHHIPTRAAV